MEKSALQCLGCLVPINQTYSRDNTDVGTQGLDAKMSAHAPIYLSPDESLSAFPLAFHESFGSRTAKTRASRELLVRLGGDLLRKQAGFRACAPKTCWHSGVHDGSMIT